MLHEPHVAALAMQPLPQRGLSFALSALGFQTGLARLCHAIVEAFAGPAGLALRHCAKPCEKHLQALPGEDLTS